VGRGRLALEAATEQAVAAEGALQPAGKAWQLAAEAEAEKVAEADQQADSNRNASTRNVRQKI
jgi:hypothetical protein